MDMNLVVVFLPIIFSLVISKMYPMDTSWYNTLDKSPYTPKDWIFGAVWPILYILIGISLTGPNNDWLLLNLMLNYLWIILFNGYKNIKAGFWILMVMCMSLILYFGQSGNYLLLSYLVWLLYALYLNYYLMTNNPKSNIGIEQEMDIEYVFVE
tara:strand:- start:1215 stop:1676 length:462 start_codon:yes stop_codon:yes gene_type:complete